MSTHPRRRRTAGVVAAAALAVLAGTAGGPARAATAPPDAPAARGFAAAPSVLATAWGTTCAPLTGVGTTAPSSTLVPAAGIAVRTYLFHQPDGSATQVVVAQADMTRVRLVPLSTSRIGTVRTVVSLARSSGAAVAVNGDFFELGTETEALTFGGQARAGWPVFAAAARPYVGADAAGLVTSGTSTIAGALTFTDPVSHRVLRRMTVTRLNAPADAGGLAVWTPVVHPDNYRYGRYPFLVRNGRLAGRADPAVDLRAYPAYQRPFAFTTTRAVDLAWLRLPVARTAVVTYSARLVDASTRAVLLQSLGAGAYAAHSGVPTSACSTVRPRTVVAWTADRRTMWFVTANGTPSTWSFWVGATYKQVGQVLGWLGADEARFLDGGGSTTMAVDVRGVVRRVDGGIPDYQREVPVGYGFLPR